MMASIPSSSASQSRKFQAAREQSPHGGKNGPSGTCGHDFLPTASRSLRSGDEQVVAVAQRLKPGDVVPAAPRVASALPRHLVVDLKSRARLAPLAGVVKGGAAIAVAPLGSRSSAGPVVLRRMRREAAP